MFASGKACRSQTAGRRSTRLRAKGLSTFRRQSNASALSSLCDYRAQELSNEIRQLRRGLVSTLFPLRPHKQDGNRRLVSHFVNRAAENEGADHPVPAGCHRNEIAFFIASSF